MPMDWASFNNAPSAFRTAAGREVTQKDFAISDTITGVNMRADRRWHQGIALAPGGGVGDQTYGSRRVTVLDAVGRPYVADQ
jgi:oxalate decarboxylase